ncbi:MAG: hypothetical protein AAB845_02845 [Patescibacteria group bacterium]
MKTTIPTPQTNLVGHRALLAWYQEILDLQAKGVIICVLMLKVPGEHGDVLCDITETRALYLERKPRCYHSQNCLPRKRHSCEATEEARLYYKRSLR